MAANQGLYNGFLSAGLVWGLVAPPQLGFPVKVFFLSCVVVAGLFGAATVSRRILIVQAPPPDLALEPADVERWIAEATASADALGVTGGAVTPHLLGYLARASGGSTLRVNIGLIVRNARTAGEIAVAASAHGS